VVDRLVVCICKEVLGGGTGSAGDWAQIEVHRGVRKQGGGFRLPEDAAGGYMSSRGHGDTLFEVNGFDTRDFANHP
jgi:hypothetical protein